MQFSEINTGTIEGMLLVSAIANLSREDELPDTVFKELEGYAKDVYGESYRQMQELQEQLSRPTTFEEKVRKAINQHSKENDSNTPDFILSEYLIKCLDNFNKTSIEREKWYGKSLSPH